MQESDEESIKVIQFLFNTSLSNVVSDSEQVLTYLDLRCRSNYRLATISQLFAKQISTHHRALHQNYLRIASRYPPFQLSFLILSETAEISIKNGQALVPRDINS